MTIKEIARSIGVSPSTVSYVLNNGPRPVHPDTRRKVLAAIRQHNYHPSAVARGLSRKRMNTIGVVNAFFVAPTINYYFVAILQGIVAAAMPLHQTTMLFVGEEWRDVGHSLPIFGDGRCDGFLLLGQPHHDELIAALHERGLPCVLVSDTSENPDVDSVDVDNVGGARQAVSYLLEQGHRRIAYLSGDRDTGSARLRMEGCESALRAAGLPLNARWVHRGKYYEGSGYEGAQQMMRLPPGERPTALFCGNDAIALGALQGLQEMGLRVPHDVSLIGFDDIPMAAMTHPALTTIHQRFDLITRRAVDRLMAQIEGSAATPVSRKEVLPAELIIRDSVAPPLRA